MPYTQATILEILRYGSVISPGERVAVVDNVIDGIFHPKVCKASTKIWVLRVTVDSNFVWSWDVLSSELEGAQF